ncbi:LysR family transcriptional regulator [Amycolatopsis suaedae]|uniref:LysR family transcriptional regulator n=1 Tax=Amycolatopsis suaedae TaxID=2510978 RepID=A0A4Q7J650_9PSEU|nr:LysR family transcriptional regulator [Amycolatopsis suaedae]RZQ61474.1 LysR family transcriptional regulator [Amycolatopsis suaedae]
MTDIGLRYLAALAAIADEGTFARAAARLGYTQSTVSQQIAALERAVGGAVFDRPGGPKPVQVTPLGAVVLAHARELLAKATAMTTAIERFKAGDGRIDIGTFQSVSTVVLPRVVRRLRDEHPSCDIRLFEEETDPPQVSELDLVFYDCRVGGDLEHLKLLDDPYLLVATPGAAPAGPVPLACLDGAPMVAYPPTCDQPRLERELARHGVHPLIVFRAAGNEALLSMVRAGLGWAILPRLAVHAAGLWDDTTLRLHTLQPAPHPRQIHLLWQSARSHSPLTERTIAITTQVAHEISHELDDSGATTA